MMIQTLCSEEKKHVNFNTWASTVNIMRGEKQKLRAVL